MSSSQTLLRGQLSFLGCTKSQGSFPFFLVLPTPSKANKIERSNEGGVAFTYPVPVPRSATAVMSFAGIDG
jgi:hypothetical protein